MDVYEARLRIGKRGVDLISDALPFGRSHDAVIRVYDECAEKL